jgi:hypothetical protein
VAHGVLSTTQSPSGENDKQAFTLLAEKLAITISNIIIETQSATYFFAILPSLPHAYLRAVHIYNHSEEYFYKLTQEQITFRKLETLRCQP